MLPCGHGASPACANSVVYVLLRCKCKDHFKGVPKICYIPCFLVLQDWLQSNYQNSIIFHHSLMYGFNRFNYVCNFHLNGKSYVYEIFLKTDKKE